MFTLLRQEPCRPNAQPRCRSSGASPCPLPLPRYATSELPPPNHRPRPPSNKSSVGRPGHPGQIAEVRQQSYLPLHKEGCSGLHSAAPGAAQDGQGRCDILAPARHRDIHAPLRPLPIASIIHPINEAIGELVLFEKLIMVIARLRYAGSRSQPARRR